MVLDTSLRPLRLAIYCSDMFLTSLRSIGFEEPGLDQPLYKQIQGSEEVVSPTAEVKEVLVLPLHLDHTTFPFSSCTAV